MRFYPQHPERLTRVRWFFVSKDTPFIPWPHAFGTRVWDYQDEPSPEIGEQNDPRPWRGGQAPSSAGSGGICGTQEQWQNGCRDSDPVPPYWPGTTIPRCCGLPPIRAIGGTGTGGGIPSATCAQVAEWPDLMTIRCDAGLAACGVPDGTEFPLFKISDAPPFFATSSFPIGTWFGALAFSCNATDGGGLRLQLRAGNPQQTWFNQLGASSSSNEPPSATFNVTVDTFGDCSSTSAQFSIFAP